MQLFDTHAHYNDEKFNEDREEVLQAIYDSGVTKLVNAGYSLESSKKALEIANNYDWMYVICGISPNDIPDNKEKIDKEILELEQLILSNITRKNTLQDVNSVENNTENSMRTVIKNKKIVAIGEI